MKEDLIIEIQSLFQSSRIKSLLENSSGIFQISSYNQQKKEIYLLLDQYEPTDIDKLKELVRIFGDKINLSYQYLDIIQKRGWYNFQLGNYGYFYILILMNARTLLGSNIFQNKLVPFSYSKFCESIYRQIEEQFWILDSLSLKDSSDYGVNNQFKKSLIIIIAYFLILRKEIVLRKLDKYTDEDIIEIALTKEYFSSATKSRLKDIFYNDICVTVLLSEVRRFLYLDYLDISRNYFTSLTSQTRFKIV